jgi:uncharacterized protein YdhG (YjbR/CyaY superfamily)
MVMALQKITSVDEYIGRYPVELQERLTQMRLFILLEFPFLDEKISYNMPAYFSGKVICYFAGYSKHIGFYPTAAPIVAFQKKIASYKTSKGAVQFPLDQDLPLTLIKEIIQFRLGGM